MGREAVLQLVTDDHVEAVRARRRLVGAVVLDLPDGVELHRGLADVLIDRFAQRRMAVGTRQDKVESYFDVYEGTVGRAGDEALVVARDLARLVGLGDSAISSVGIAIHDDDNVEYVSVLTETQGS